MILHILTSQQLSADCLNLLSENDALLLIQDGVYTLHTQGKDLVDVPSLFVLKEDYDARGLSANLPSAQFIDYEQFVALTLTYEKTITW